MPRAEIYFDNAATSYPKPPGVRRALTNFYIRYGASAGRGVYPRAVAVERLLAECRQQIAGLFEIPDPRRIVFTLNASDALNLALKGLPWRPKDRVLISPFEHNSVLRPLQALRQKLDLEIDTLPVDSEGRVVLENLKKFLRPRTRLIACAHASNVTGVLQPAPELGWFARSKGILFLADTSQSAGAVPVSVPEMKADLLAFPGHKGLLGPLGTGGLYVRPGLDLAPLREGGTGSVSEQDVQPDFLPDKFEPGSHNAPGIAGLLEGVKFVRRRGVEAIRRHETDLLKHFLDGLRRIPDVRRFGPAHESDMAAVVSVRVAGLTALRAARRLWTRHGLMVRAGLHCAPRAHKTIGTFPEGTVRFSFGPFTTHAQIDAALRALRELRETRRRIPSDDEGKSAREPAREPSSIPQAEPAAPAAVA